MWNCAQKGCAVQYWGMTLTTVMEVWRYSFLFYSLAFLLIAKNLPKPRISPKTICWNKEFSISILFSTLLGVWITGWNTVSCVWYITSMRCNIRDGLGVYFLNFFVLSLETVVCQSCHFLSGYKMLMWFFGMPSKLEI